MSFSPKHKGRITGNIMTSRASGVGFGSFTSAPSGDPRVPRTEEEIKALNGECKTVFLSQEEIAAAFERADRKYRRK
jgi:hypothetical protein